MPLNINKAFANVNERFISFPKSMYIGDLLAAQQGSKTSINSEEPWITNPQVDKKLYTKEPEPDNKVNLFGPLFIWALVIIVGIVLEVVIPALLGKNLASYAAPYETLGSYILTLPGVIILPLIISVWIGHKVGERASSTKNAVKMGLINGVYASIVYGVIIFISQLVLKYTTTYTLTTDFMIKYLIAIPVTIVIIFTIIIAMLNELRH